MWIERRLTNSWRLAFVKRFEPPEIGDVVKVFIADDGQPDFTGQIFQSQRIELHQGGIGLPRFFIAAKFPFFLSQMNHSLLFWQGLIR